MDFDHTVLRGRLAITTSCLSLNLVVAQLTAVAPTKSTF
uniref:Uncharacterized protein n=1 Tax=Anguilla anguilla TaxID=7936 RepID=A0A0E9VUB8_ANGAN